MAIVFRKFLREMDYSEQRHLFALSFPETIGTTVESDAHYNWKFQTCPAFLGGPSAYEYIGYDSELVAYYAALPYRYQIGGEVRSCGMVCDVMTHPDRRGKGIFTKIGYFATEDLKQARVDFTTGYPIRPEVIPGHLKVGWHVVMKLPMYLRPVTVNSFLPTPFKFLKFFINPILLVLQSWSLVAQADFTCEVLSRNEFLANPEYDSFQIEWLGSQNNALIKDKNFVAWRTSAPGTDYQFVVLRHNSKWVGLAIARATVLRGIHVLALIDMMVLPDHFAGTRSLHAALFKQAKKFKRDAVVCMTSSEIAKRYGFLRSCYVRTPAVFSLIVKKLSDTISAKALSTPSNWHLFWIDSDDL